MSKKVDIFDEEFNNDIFKKHPSTTQSNKRKRRNVKSRKKMQRESRKINRRNN